MIKSLHDKGYGYRRIANKLNDWGAKTTRGKKWFNTSVSSVLKRKHERDIRIEEIRNKEYPIKIGKFRLTYYTYLILCGEWVYAPITTILFKSVVAMVVESATIEWE